MWGENLKLFPKEILDKIERMKNSIRLMSDESKEKTIKYLQNLNKLCKLYYIIFTIKPRNCIAGVLKYN